MIFFKIDSIYFFLDEIMQLTQENLKKIDLVSSNNGLKEQNLILEKETIKTLELLKNAKQKVVLNFNIIYSSFY